MKPRLRHASILVAALLACIPSFNLSADTFGEEHASTQQQQRRPSRPTATPTPTAPAATPVTSQTGARSSAAARDEATSQPRRAQAYAKLLEGQRYLNGARSGALPPSALRNAQAAFQQAAQLDPALAEAHTALAEIAFLLQDIELAETEASTAARINGNNFGARRILSRIQTARSNLFEGQLDRERAERAVAELREVARLDPRDAEAWALLAEFYQVLGREKEAIEALDRWAAAPAPIDTRFFETLTGGRELTPDAAFARLGEIHLQAGRIAEAVTAIRRALAIAPNNLRYLELLSNTISGAGGEQQTILAELRRFVEANPTNANATSLLARAQARAGRVDEAVATLRAAIARGSDNAAPREQLLYRTELAQVLADALRYTEAITVYEEMLKARGINDATLRSDNEKRFATQILNRIVGLRKQAGQFGQARADIERLRRLLGDDTVEADVQQILLLRAEGKRQEALEATRRARQIHTEAAELVRLEASLLAELGRVEEGATILRGRLKGEAADYNEYLSLANLYLEAGRGREAVEAARKALGLAPPDQRELVTQALFMLSSAQERAGDPKGSEETLRRILSTDPNNANALNNLGYFLVERNERLGEALEMLRRAVRAEPNNPSFLDSLGWAHFKLGQLDEAERYLSDASRRNPSSVAINEHLGDLYQRRGQADKARTAWQKALTLATEAADTARIKAKLNGTTK